MAQRIAELGAAEERVDRHDDGAEAPDAERAAQPVAAVGHQDADAGAFADAEPGQRRGDAARVGREIGEGDDVVAGAQRRLACRARRQGAFSLWPILSMSEEQLGAYRPRHAKATRQFGSRGAVR